MKKLILLSLALAIGAVGFSQKKAVVPASIANKAVKVKNHKAITGDEKVIEPLKQVNNYVAVPHTSSKGANLGTTIGTTTYDLATNGSTDPHRIICYNDGTVAAAWMFSAAGNLNATDRGTGYNYYNGTTWGPVPTARVETIRTGWPSFAPVITSTGASDEFKINHSAAVTATPFLAYQSPKGGTAWTTSNTPTAVAAPVMWPRMATNGDSTIHMIGVVEPVASSGSMFMGLDGALVYSRSNDGGKTWTALTTLPGLDSTAGYIGFSGDSYAIDCKGDTVVIASFGQWYNVAINKSTDGGNTWKTTVVWQFPIPSYDFINDTQLSDVNGDGVADTITTSDETGAVILDKNGTAHLFFGVMKVTNDVVGDGTSSYFPGTDGMLYWKEGMKRIDQGGGVMCASMVDINGNGHIDLDTTVVSPNLAFGQYYKSLTSFANAGYDSNNNIYCIYSSVTEGTTFGDGRAFRNIWAIKHLATDNDTVWSAPVNITNDVNSESVYPTMGKKIGANLQFIFQNDYEPGLCITPSTSNPNTDFDVNNWNYLTWDKNAFQTGAVAVSIASNATSCNVYQLTANPLPATGTYTYNWAPSTGLSATNIKNPVATITTSANYTVTITDNSSNTASSSVAITYTAKPAAPVVTQNGNVLTSSVVSGNQWYKNNAIISGAGATNQTYTITTSGKYYDEVTVNGCVSDTSNNITSYLGIKEISNISNISFFPNPSHGTTNIEVSIIKASDINISISNMLGQKVFEVNKGTVNAGTYTYTFDATMLRSGVYYYTVKAGSQSITNKIVIE